MVLSSGRARGNGISMSNKGVLRVCWDGVPRAVLGKIALVLLVTFVGYIGGQWNAGLTRLETNLTERLEKLEAKVDRNAESLAYIKDRLDVLERSQPSQSDPVSPASVAPSVPIVHPALWSTGWYPCLGLHRRWL